MEIRIFLPDRWIWLKCPPHSRPGLIEQTSRERSHRRPIRICTKPGTSLRPISFRILLER